MPYRNKEKYDALMDYGDMAVKYLDPDVLRSPAEIRVDVQEWAQFTYGDPKNDYNEE